MEMKKHIMKLNPTPMKMFKQGNKTIELRLYDEKRQKISVGDSIKFVNTQDITDVLNVLLRICLFSAHLLNCMKICRYLNADTHQII